MKNIWLEKAELFYANCMSFVPNYNSAQCQQCVTLICVRLVSFKKPQARTPQTPRFRVCISSSTVSCPCSFSYHKTKILEPASAISWVCHLYALTLPLLQGTEWWFDAAPLLLPLWFSRKLISASFTPRSSHSESQCFIKGEGEGFLFLHYLARLVVCFPHPWTISGSQ